MNWDEDFGLRRETHEREIRKNADGSWSWNHPPVSNPFNMLTVDDVKFLLACGITPEV